MTEAPQILILGQGSNLSRHLARAWPDAVVCSARALLDGAPLSVGDGPLQVVINSFQPATRLGDLSSPTRFVGLSITATAMLLEALAGRDVRKILYTSSAAVYGDNAQCRETDRPRAAGLHAGLKVANEDLVARFGAIHDIDVTVVRLFNMYGGDDPFSIVSKIVAAATGGEILALVNGGNAIRDFVHVDDVVRSYTALLEAEVDIVNVASGIGISIRGLLDALSVRGIDVQTTDRRRDEIRVSTADVDRLGQFVDVGAFRHAADWVVAEVTR